MNYEQGQINLNSISLMLAITFLALFNGGFDNQIIYFVLLLLIGQSLLLTKSNEKNIDINFAHPFIYLLLLLIWSFVSVFWSLNPHRTLVEFLQLISYALAFLLVIQLDQFNIFKLGRIIAINGVLIALFGISMYLFINPARIQGTFTNPNPFGIYLAMIFCYMWGYFLREPNRWLIISSLLILTSLALTGSRGSFISLAISLPLLFLGMNRKQQIVGIGRTVLTIVSSLLLTNLVMFAAPLLQQRFPQRELFQFLTRPESIIATSGAGRLAFWKVALKLVASNPFIGYGLGTHYLAYPMQYTGNQWYSRFTHNHYLQIAVELGIIGLVLFSGFLLTGLKAVRIKLRENQYPVYYPGILAALATFLIHIAIDFSWNFPAVTILFFSLAGVAIGGENYYHSLVVNRFSFQKIILIFLLVLTVWQFSASLVYRQAAIISAKNDVIHSISVYEKANMYYPINPTAFSFTSEHYLLLYRETGETIYLDKALSNAKQAVALSPTDGGLQNSLGNIYQYLGDVDKAEEHLIIGVKYAAYRLEIYLDLAWFYIQQQRFHDAEMVLLAGLELKEAALKSSLRDKDKVIENVVTLHLLLARIYQDAGQDSLADIHNNAAKKLGKDHPVVQQFFSNTI